MTDKKKDDEKLDWLVPVWIGLCIISIGMTYGLAVRLFHIFAGR